MKRLQFAVLMATTALVGCGTPKVEVASRWIESFSQYNMVPLYPVQEDALPGDIYLLGSDTQANATVPGSGWKVRMAQPKKKFILQLLADTYAERPVFTDENKKPLRDTEGNDVYLENPDGRPIRLHRLALPELSVARYTAADLSGGGAFSIANLFAALSGNSQAAIDVSVEGLSELHLPANRLLDGIRAELAGELVKDLLPSLVLELIAQRDRGLARAACDLDFTRLDEANLFVMVANEVIYARQLSYSYSDSSTFTGRLTADLTPRGAAAGGGAATTSTEPTAAGTTSTTQTAASPSTTATSKPAAQLAADVQAAMVELAKQHADGTTIGAKVSFGIGRSGNITMKQTFVRPMAIGFAGSIRFTIGDLMEAYAATARASAPAALTNDLVFISDRCEAFGVKNSKLVELLQGGKPVPTSASIGVRPPQKIR